MIRATFVALLALVAVACSSSGTSLTPATTTPIAADTTVASAPALTTPTTTTLANTPTTTVTDTTTTLPNPYARPAWLGSLLPAREDGFGHVLPTPPELVDRQLETYDLLPPPAGEAFEASIESVPADVVARSTWSEECPVTLDELAYVTVSHWGFDQEFHTGEIIVNAGFAEEVVDIFRTLHEARFPIEQMRVIDDYEIELHPTGDFNDTTSFVCRPAVGSTGWSQHAFGLAVDINPFHNPYLKGDLVLPELASAYTDRSDVRSGMIVAGDVVTDSFGAIGWGWGGNWNSLKDWMHFSLSGN